MKNILFLTTTACVFTFSAATGMEHPQKILSDIDNLHVKIRKTKDTQTRKEIVKEKVLLLLEELGKPTFEFKKMKSVDISCVLHERAKYYASACNFLGDNSNF